MNIDTRINNDFFQHPKTVKLQAELGEIAPMFLIKLWLYASKFFPDGIIRNMDEKTIEKQIGWDGNHAGKFMQTLEKIGFIERNGDDFLLHGWADHNQWASHENNRKDLYRFNTLARYYPDIAKLLKKHEINAITESQYKAIKAAENPLKTVQKIFKLNTYGNPCNLQCKWQCNGICNLNANQKCSLTNTNTNTKSNTIIPPKSPQGENKGKDFEFGTDPVEAEFLRLRDCYNQYARQEAPFTGWKEFQRLKWDASYPGIDSLCYDIMERSEKNFWKNGYEFGLVRYLNERVWLQKILPRLSEDEIKRQKTREALLKIQQEEEDDDDAD